MSFDLETLYNLLPAVYRIRDLEQCSSPDECDQPLRSLLSVIVEQIGILEENLAQLYDDQFIETCADWVVPYIGDLVGYKMPHLISSHNLRSDVANTLNYRKRKGTALLMEELLQGVTGWCVHIVEYFPLLAASQHVNRPSPQNQLIDVSRRGAQELELLGTPFERSVHSVDVRATSSKYERYNVANIGVFVWRLGAYSLTEATAARAFANDAHRYRFSPLGNDLQLFCHPERNEGSATQLAGPLAVPMPIDRSMLARSLSDYYGQGKSLRLTIIDEEGKRTHAHEDSIIVGDLSDSKDSDGHAIEDAEGNPSWATTPADSIVIDPILGRIALPKHIKHASLCSTFHYGFSADIGGGEYTRDTSFTRSLRVIEHVPRLHTSISQALKTLHAHAEHVVSLRSARDASLKALDVVPVHAGHVTLRSTSEASLKVLDTVPAHTEDGAVEIADSGSYVELPTIRAIGKQCIELRAADSCRPLLILDAPTGIAEMQISGEEQCHVILNGLVISNGILRVTGNLGRLSLRHCTLVPGLSLSENGEPQHPHRPSLVIDSPHTLVEIDHCIVGALHVQESAQVRITNSIVDATSKHNVAYAAHVESSAHPTPPGGSLSIQNSTIIGRVATVSLELASNTIFLASPRAPREPPLYVERRQEGCVRYSYVPPGSRTPRCYQCQPQESVQGGQAEDMEPIFTSLRYGNPGYCQLLLRSPANIRMNIRKGADDQSEMGVFHDLLQPQRAANLHLRLREYLPLTMKPGVVYMT